MPTDPTSITFEQFVVVASVILFALGFISGQR